MTQPHVNLQDIHCGRVIFQEKLILLRPSLRKSSHVYTRRQVVIVLTPDLKRVFVGESEYEFPELAYEADTLAIEALADRFDLPELQRALALRNAK